VYVNPPANAFIMTGADLEDPYFHANLDILNHQLARAGVRLQKLLNAALP